MLLGILAAGCGRPAAAAASAVTAAPAQPAEQRHPLTGEIVKADPGRSVLIVAHDEIKGFMMAMTMEFKVSPGDLAIARPGQHIRAELVQRDDGFYLEKIWPDDAATQRALDAAAKALAQDTAMRGKEAYREIGESLPEFTLLDQEGRAVAGSRFRGKQIVLNFIFTRCPIATMCPAATQRMSELQRAAKAAGAKDLELVSISLDPEYDTPGVLKEYAQLRGLDTSNWSFLTGPDAAVRHLLAQLGVIREFEGATIKHTLATVLINEQGKITHRVDGSVWAVDDFVRYLKKG
ncbi:MAG: SCO family protein [Opitutae bacterium]|nr:SCO family protein [Opitutae bacterium]